MANHLQNDYQRKHSSISSESFDPSLDPPVSSRCSPYSEYPDNLCDPSKLWSFSEGSSIYSGSSGYSSSASCYENSDASSDCSFSSFNSTSDFDQESELPAAHLTFDIDDGREESERLRSKIFVELNFSEQVPR